MDHSAAVDLLGNGRHICTGRRLMSLKDIWAVLRRSRGFWLLVVATFITSAAATVSLVYLFKSVRLARARPSSGLPVHEFALNEQLQALRLNSPWQDDGVSTDRVCNTSDCVNAAFHLLFGMNDAANPCDDFYEFSCGNWMELYKDQRVDYDHYEEMTIPENALVEEILIRPPESFEFQPMKTAATFYHQCVHEEDMNSVVDLTAKLGNWPSLEGENWNEDAFDLETTLAFIRRQSLSPIFVGVNLAPHGVNERVYVLQFTVPEFLSEHDLKNQTVMTAFKSQYTKTLGELTGYTDWRRQWSQDADEIFELEKALAEAVTVPDANANASNSKGTFTVADFQEYLEESLNWLHKPVSNNSISWKRLLNEIFSTSGIQINDDQLLIVADLGYFSRMAQILDATPTRTIANYVFWSMAIELLPEASTKMEHVVEELSWRNGKLLDLQPRENYCFLFTVAFFDVPIIHEYLKTKSNLKARAIVDKMTANLQATFAELLQSNNWLSDATKLAVQKKLKALNTIIGYPDWLLNTAEIGRRFEGLHAGSNFIETFGNVMQWRNDKILRQLGQRPGHTEEPLFDAQQTGGSFSVFQDYSLIFPTGVETHHYSFYNYLVLSMGFIQPHYFYKDVPSYVNYGRLGAVIGHEIIHGFDTTRKNLDENGRFDYKSWTDEDEQSYEERSDCFRDQYNKFEASPGVYVDGSSSLDENIADNDGLRLAYLTYNEEYARTGNNQQILPGFEKLSAQQLFFLSYGSLWCEHGNEAIRQYVLGLDPHSPAKYRVNAVLQNSAEFADAWNCPAGVPMNPIKKCTLW